MGNAVDAAGSAAARTSSVSESVSVVKDERVVNACTRPWASSFSPEWPGRPGWAALGIWGRGNTLRVLLGSFLQDSRVQNLPFIEEGGGTASDLQDEKTFIVGLVMLFVKDWWRPGTNEQRLTSTRNGLVLAIRDLDNLEVSSPSDSRACPEI